MEDNLNSKEQALRLFNEYAKLLEYELPAKRHNEEIKKCAIICVKTIENYGNLGIIEKLYWKDVKLELLKL